MNRLWLYGLILFCLVGCSSSAERKVSCEVRSGSYLAFSSDSAYQFIQHQVDFGPRVPGTEAHGRCVDYLVKTLERYGAIVSLQEGTQTDYLGQSCPVRNIVATWSDSAVDTRRILLMAHYDSRPWCDQDQDSRKWHTPVSGANDGASGVGVLLEVARQIHMLRLSQQDSVLHPVEIVFFDAEDMGTPAFYDGGDNEDTWCLGSQLWVKHLTHPEQYTMGILLDMVGAPGAMFQQEYFSLLYAPTQVQTVWQTAAMLGHEAWFIPKQGGAITDDHLYVNRAGIPCVDVIDCRPTATGFPTWWHTSDDNMNTINCQTLQAVGETVMSMISIK